MKPKRPKVFIGSSTEALPIARAIQAELADDAECHIWNQGLFHPSKSTLGSLDTLRFSYDFALMVFSPDDTTARGGTGTPTWNPRDNVIFETGLFMATLGRERTLIVAVNNSSPRPREAEQSPATDVRNLKMLSDLAGITYLPVDGSIDDPRTAVGPACERIRATTNRLGRLWEGREFTTIDEGHETLYEILKDPKTRSFHHAAISNRRYTPTPTTLQFAEHIDEFSKLHDRCVFYLFSQSDTLPHRLARAQKLLQSQNASSPTESRNIRVRQISNSATPEHPSLDPHYGPNFIIVGKEHVFAFIQPDLDPHDMLLLRGVGVTKVFKNIFRALWALGGRDLTLADIKQGP